MAAVIVSSGRKLSSVHILSWIYLTPSTIFKDADGEPSVKRFGRVKRRVVTRPIDVLTRLH